MNNPQAEWRDARTLYPFYVALCREFVIEIFPCHALQTDDQAPEPEDIENARQWFLAMDGRIQIHQLRQFLQTSSLAGDESLLRLLQHFLSKQNRTNADRDKLDFLLVQFFSHCAPPRIADDDVTLEYVAGMLKPALGEVQLQVPNWMKPIEELIKQAKQCGNLNEILGSKVLEEGRKLKTSCGEEYYVPAVMVAFTRFSFLMRRVFFCLMHQELNAILDGLRQLELRGVTTLDCRRAQFSAEEPIARLRMICQSWKVIFHAEYSAGQPLRMLVDLKAAVDSALADSPPAESKPAERTKAAAAGAEVAEFEVSTGTPDWNSDTNNWQ